MKQREIIKTFSDFMDGYRLLLLIHRNKEGGKSNRPQKNGVKRITKNKKEFLKTLKELQILKEESILSMRIYSCVNKRDIDKTIREFKRRQLEADYYDTNSKHRFYLDIKNQWISSLMKLNSRDETKFLIDIDKDDAEEEIKNFLETKEIGIYLEYSTKNGKHIITEPFNPSEMPFIDIKKDGLLLLDY